MVNRTLTYTLTRTRGTLSFDSTTLEADKYMEQWPREGSTLLECIELRACTNLTITSSTEGTLDGRGGKWWGIPGIGYLRRQEHRPRLLKISDSKDVLVQHTFLKDSPYWSFLASAVTNLEVRYSRIEAWRMSHDSHSVVDLSAFNTDGFDMAGCDNVWIHDCSVWNQDDCFDVKDGTKNVLIERVKASGLGLTIGSISSNVSNITFRDAHMSNTVKGIYMKFRGAGTIADVLYENIVMDGPEQFAIWIGPAQQCDGCSVANLCSTDGGPCSLCWPDIPGTECNAPADAHYVNITLRNVTVNNPKKSAGVLLANATSPGVNIVFDGVVVNNPSSSPFGKDQYYCKNMQGIAIGGTSPVPPCFTDLTTNAKSVTGS
eukprot:TRINITY_DN12600_c0_g1_i7.p1 TRINITY_DN12600_c0_g1~~TRINITY_DN12600_c0_g1_i7.p1  ORF type:complete len:375 (+),score=74.85 TRINITY_DN12600_c0_g1_i7:202-1326(+)